MMFPYQWVLISNKTSFTFSTKVFTVTNKRHKNKSCTIQTKYTMYHTSIYQQFTDNKQTNRQVDKEKSYVTQQ